MTLSNIFNSADKLLPTDHTVEMVKNIQNGEINVDRYANLFPPYAVGPNPYHADMASYYHPGAFNMYVCGLSVCE